MQLNWRKLWLVLFFYSSHGLAFDLIFEAGSAPEYAHPHDLVLSPDRQYLYVADNANHRIAVLDPYSLKLIATFGEGQLSERHDVVFQSAQRLLVADTGNDRIAIFKVKATVAELVGELRGAISRPEGVAVHPNGRVYASGAGSGNVEVFDKGVSAGQTGGLSSPHDVSIAPDGSLWIADSGNHRIIHMSEQLRVKRVLKGAPYNFDGPRYFAFDSHGRLYIADKYNHQIKVLSPDTSLLYTLGTGDSGMGPGKFDRPEGIEIHGQDVWFSDTYNNRIVRYRIQH